MEFNREDLTKIAMDSVYVTVGLGVVTVQQLDALRRQLAERLSSQLGLGKEQVEQVAKAVETQFRGLDDRVKTLESELEKLLDSLQEKLPETAGDVLNRARKATADARKAATEAGERFTGFVRDVAA